MNHVRESRLGVRVGKFPFLEQKSHGFFFVFPGNFQSFPTVSSLAFPPSNSHEEVPLEEDAMASTHSLAGLITETSYLLNGYRTPQIPAESAHQAHTNLPSPLTHTYPWKEGSERAKGIIKTHLTQEQGARGGQ